MSEKNIEKSKSEDDVVFYKKIYQFENLSWDEINNYSENTPLKMRPIILVDLKDKLNRKYNAVVVNTYITNNDFNDKRERYVHIRYFDNPKHKLFYWWTGNSNRKAGLDKKTRSNIIQNLGYGTIKNSDFVENGYDDLINFDKEPERFYKTMKIYPFLNGLYGNIYIHDYYKND
jgi:hypothetical protein